VQDIIDWVKAHRRQVEIAATKAYEVYDLARLAAPQLREPNLGERAAVASRVAKLNAQTTPCGRPYAGSCGGTPT
jgi:hypothetical protein